MKQTKWNVKRIVKIGLNTIFYGVIVFLMLFSVANMRLRSENNIANIFGVGLLSVQTDSMTGTFDPGDMLFVSMLDESDFEDLEVGDIVTYFDVQLGAFNTHRIVEINLDEQFLTTKADYAGGNGSVAVPDQPVAFDRVIARYDGQMIAGLGSGLDYMQTSVGFALFVILPVLIVLIIEGVILARHIMAMNREKLEQKYAEERLQVAQSLESEREKLRAEILAEMTREKALHA